MRQPRAAGSPRPGERSGNNASTLTPSNKERRREHAVLPRQVHEPAVAGARQVALAHPGVFDLAGAQP